MALVFVLPGALRELAGSRTEVRVDATADSLAAALDLLWEQCPAVRDRVLTEQGELRPHVNVFVGGQNSRYAGGLGAAVQDGSEIVILPSVSGG